MSVEASSEGAGAASGNIPLVAVVSMKSGFDSIFESGWFLAQ